MHKTRAQVRFVHEVLKKLRPGVPLRALHGGMKQTKRMAVFYEFCQVCALLQLTW
jgi:ATP-dependent RNA helicase DDX10/DBP4